LVWFGFWWWWWYWVLNSCLLDRCFTPSATLPALLQGFYRQALRQRVAWFEQRQISRRTPPRGTRCPRETELMEDSPHCIGADLLSQI
jgi:hypothetical protein